METHVILANGPAAAMVFYEFLEDATPQEVIDWAQGKLRNFSFNPSLNSIVNPTDYRTETWKLRDQAVSQLLEVLEKALENRAFAILPSSDEDRIMRWNRVSDEYLAFVKELYWRLPVFQPHDNDLVPPGAYVETRKKLIKEIANWWDNTSCDKKWSPSVQVEFRFLIAAYEGKSPNVATPPGELSPTAWEVKNFIEGFLREKLQYFSREAIAMCLRESDLPGVFQKILTIAWVKASPHREMAEFIFSQHPQTQ